MKKRCVAVLVLLAAACASSPVDEPETTPTTSSYPAPQTVAAPDPRVGELQTQLTELLERIDVLNQRIASLEEARVEPASEPVRTTQAVTPVQQEHPAQQERPAQQPAAAAPQQTQRALVGAEIAENYRQAIMLVGRNRHLEARRAFQGVYDADPSGDLADNALFWIGETYYNAKDYTNAVRFYQRVVNDYPTQNKAPDALFKIAMAQERTGDLALARRTLQQVIERFPYSSPASSAKAELERIRF